MRFRLSIMSGVDCRPVVAKLPRFSHRAYLSLVEISQRSRRHTSPIAASSCLVAGSRIVRGSGSVLCVLVAGVERLLAPDTVQHQQSSAALSDPELSDPALAPAACC